MIDLYTWDYVALRTGRRPNVAPHLVAAGLWTAVTIPPTVPWGNPTTAYDPTSLGLAWADAVEAAWEREVSHLQWWSVTLGVGVTVLGLPGLHPEEAESDLRRLLGSGGRLCEPRTDDDSPGHPKRLPADWRPWRDGGHAWIDMTTDGRPWWRGAYMRAWGGQFDPGLGVYECAGEAPPERDSGRGEQWSLARGVCRINVPIPGDSHA